MSHRVNGMRKLVWVSLLLFIFSGSLFAQGLQITTATLPGGVVGQTYPITILSATGGTPPLHWCWNNVGVNCVTFVQTGTTPPGLTLSDDGIISGTPTTAGTFNFLIRVSDATQSAQRAFTVVIAPVMTITTSSLPDGRVGIPYPSQSLTLSGGTAPFSWSVISGSLPPGLAMSGGGVINGTPTMSGRFLFTVRVVDSGSPQQTATKDLAIAVPPTILTATPLANGAEGVAYSQTITATAGTNPFTWSVTAGSLPPGLTLTQDGVNAFITGTPTTAGTTNFTIGMADSSTPPLTATKDFSITVQSPITITTPTDLPLALVGVFYSQQLLSSGPTPVTWSVVSGSLPPGLSLSASGNLAGNATISRTFDFTVQAAGGTPTQTTTKALRLVVNPALAITTPSALPDGRLTVPYSTTLVATGGLAPYTWTVQGGQLPPGLSLSTAGVISGTPASIGTFVFAAQVADTFTPQQQVSRTFQIAVTNAMVVTTSTLPNGTVGFVYGPQTLQASGGTAPLSWAVSAGTLPAGLSLATNGVLTGTPTTAGTANFTVSVNDASNPAQLASKALTLIVDGPLTITTAADLPPGEVGAFYSQQIMTSGPTPVAWTVLSGIFPPGVVFTTTGNLAGTPTVSGNFTFTLQAAAGTPQQTVTREFRLTINPALAISTSATLPDAALGTPYSFALTATGGFAPYSWSLAGGTLPAGLTLSSSGVISGTPTGLGGSTFAIKATDSFNPPQETTRTFTLTVTNTLVITTQTLPNAIQNVAYSQQLQATGGVGTLVWLVTGGALPTGLVLSQGGLLQGIPTTISTMTFRATVTDSRGTTSSRDFTLPVDPPLPPFSAPGLPLTVTPTQQVVVNVALAAPYPSTLTGQLNLTFTSNAEVPSDDPMCQFSNGTRTVNFTIPAGTTAAVFPSTVVLITGTVAGTVRLTANIDNGPVDLSVATMEITSTPPKITQASAVKTGSGIDIRITGYSPSRRVTTAEFTFVLRNGNDTQTFTIPRSVDADFAVWYRNPASTTYGSAFSYVQSFIVDPSITIESVTVRLTNAQGSASSVPLKPN